MRDAFLLALASAREGIDLVELEVRLAAGDIEGVIAMLPWEIFRSKLGIRSTTAMRNVIEGVSQLAANDLTARLGVEVGFDLASGSVTRWITEAQSEFLSTSVNVSRDAIRQEVTAAFTDGVHPRILAERIKEHMGLTTRQMQSVRNFEAKLVDQGISPEQIQVRKDRLIEAHRKSRSQVIARTETSRAAAAGQQLVWEDAVKQGYMQESKLKRRWIVTPDDRLCVETCEPMNEQTVGLKEDFITGEGEAVFNVPAHPLCRCVVALEISK